ncbi:Uncharacterised protein [Mycobacteroides abscessus subsp. abscessus]|nr:hypothetical protein L830_1124 [Mycobacteroides abscessus MAB_082312_2258]SHW32042.1 Uncharacterised protein [Mycobacteroides abscessus subsp. abscessus]
MREGNAVKAPPPGRGTRGRPLFDDPTEVPGSAAAETDSMHEAAAAAAPASSVKNRRRSNTVTG